MTPPWAVARGAVSSPVCWLVPPPTVWIPRRGDGYSAICYSLQVDPGVLRTPKEVWKHIAQGLVIKDFSLLSLED